MVVFPNCKINLGLNVVRKRTDGFHDLETIFYPIALHDGLEIVTASGFQFESTGLPINGSNQDNIVCKAWNLLRQDFPGIPPVHIHLHKVIPMGAGLGGGSSNGAYILQMLNDKYHLQISKERLIVYALTLGSDCPFFIINQPCFATCRGEKMEPISLDLSGYKILLVNSGIHVSTKEAFANVTPALPAKSPKEIILQPIDTWKNELKNDFEESVFPNHPQIKQIKQAMYAEGALYASMTGTGSTVFGIFEHEAVPDTSLFSSPFLKWV